MRWSHHHTTIPLGLRLLVFGRLPLTFDHANTPMPVTAAAAAAAGLELQQLLHAFAEDAMVQKLTRGLHPVGT